MKTQNPSTKNKPTRAAAKRRSTGKGPKPMPNIASQPSTPNTEPEVFSAKPGPTGEANNPEAMVAACIGSTVYVYHGRQSNLFIQDVDYLLFSTSTDIRTMVPRKTIMGIRARYATADEAKAVWAKFLALTGYQAEAN